TIFSRDWSADVCSSDLAGHVFQILDDELAIDEARIDERRLRRADDLLNSLLDVLIGVPLPCPARIHGDNALRRCVEIGEEEKLRSEERRGGKGWRSR